MNEATAIKADDGVTLINGQPYMQDAKGNLTPLESIKPATKLEDETVRKILGYATDLSEQIARFKQHTFDDLGDFEALLAQEYGAKKGGAKGNKTFRTFDGQYVVQIRVSDFIDFGPQLQIAKGLVDECLNEWAADAREEIRALITRAFNTDKAGNINRADIFMLLRLDIKDERWQRAMTAIRDAMRVVSSKIYVSCFEKDETGGLSLIPLNIASV